MIASSVRDLVGGRIVSDGLPGRLGERCLVGDRRARLGRDDAPGYDLRAEERRRGPLLGPEHDRPARYLVSLTRAGEVTEAHALERLLRSDSLEREAVVVRLAWT